MKNEIARGPQFDEVEVSSPSRWIVRLAWWLYVSVVVIGVALLTGCATLPPVCPGIPLKIVTMNDAGVLDVFDERQMSMLSERMRALEAGECRLGKTGDQIKREGGEKPKRVALNA